MKNLLSWFQRGKPVEIKLTMNPAEWHDGHAEALFAFLSSADGQLFIQHLKAWERETNSWAIDTGDQSWTDKRAYTAKGVALTIAKLLSFARKPKVVAKLSEKDMNDFASRRMGLFKPKQETK